MVVELRQAVDRVITVGRVFRHVRPRTNHNPLDFISPRTSISSPRTSISVVMDENSAHYEAILAEHGAEFRGIQQGQRESLVLFADPEFRTTLLTVPESEFSSQAVSRRLQESRRAYELDSHVQKSLC
jgi:hypothetical protein